MKDANGKPVTGDGEELLKNLGLILRGFREDTGYSQREAAALVGSIQGTVSYLENGKVDAHILTIQKWANLYGYNLELHFAPIEDEFDKLLREAVEDLAPETGH